MYLYRYRSITKKFDRGPFSFTWINVSMYQSTCNSADIFPVCVVIQGTPALTKAEVPWSARRGTLSDKDRVLKTVKG